MTDITDQDRRDARQWAEAIGRSDAPCAADLWHAASRYILATVDAPAPTLAEELREFAKWVENPIWRETKAKVESMADRAEQIEQERDEARAEVERLTAERDRIASGRHITYEELDELPDGTIILDRLDICWEKSLDDKWYFPGDPDSHPSGDIALPATILHHPEGTT